MERTFDEEIASLFEMHRLGRYMFNAEALKALGIDPVHLQQRGYLLTEHGNDSVQCDHSASWPGA